MAANIKTMFESVKLEYSRKFVKVTEKALQNRTFHGYLHFDDDSLILEWLKQLKTQP